MNTVWGWTHENFGQIHNIYLATEYELVMPNLCMFVDCLRFIVQRIFIIMKLSTYAILFFLLHINCHKIQCTFHGLLFLLMTHTYLHVAFQFLYRIRYRRSYLLAIIFFLSRDRLENIISKNLWLGWNHLVNGMHQNNSLKMLVKCPSTILFKQIFKAIHTIATIFHSFFTIPMIFP